MSKLFSIGALVVSVVSGLLSLVMKTDTQVARRLAFADSRGRTKV